MPWLFKPTSNINHTINKQKQSLWIRWSSHHHVCSGLTFDIASHITQIESFSCFILRDLCVAQNCVSTNCSDANPEHFKTSILRQMRAYHGWGERRRVRLLQHKCQSWIICKLNDCSSLRSARVKVVKRWIYVPIKVAKGSLSHGWGLATALLSAISDIIVCFIVLCLGTTRALFAPFPDPHKLYKMFRLENHAIHSHSSTRLRLRIKSSRKCIKVVY